MKKFKVTMQSGETYVFLNYENSWRFVYGTHEGIVAEFISLEVGKPLRLNFYPLDWRTCEPKEQLMFKFTLDPIISINAY